MMAIPASVLPAMYAINTKGMLAEAVRKAMEIKTKVRMFCARLMAAN